MKRRLKPATLLRRFKTHCVLCRRRIPMKRQRRRSITCAKKHQLLLTQMRKLERDARKCSVCSRPVTQEEKSLFRAFRHSQIQGQRKKSPKASKGILTPAEAKQKLKEFAYVVELGPKRRGTAKRRKGAAA